MTTHNCDQSQVGAPLRSIVEQLGIIYFINDSVTGIRLSINLLHVVRL